MEERMEHVVNKRFRRRKVSLRFEDVDMRTREASRLREVLEGLMAEFGADANPDTLRELAIHRVALEANQAGAIAGAAGASNRAVRHSNVILRLERALRKRQARRPELSLAEYLARGYGLEAESGRVAGDDGERAA
jgi:hypothetical protein